MNRLPLGDRQQKGGRGAAFKGKGAQREGPASAMRGCGEQLAGWRRLRGERGLGLGTPPSLEAGPAFCSTKQLA